MADESSVLSVAACHVRMIATQEARARRSCYPAWQTVMRRSGFSEGVFLDAFEELCAVGIIAEGVPSTLVDLEEEWPLPPYVGPIRGARPSGSAWESIRRRIFARDNYTCRYCGVRGVRLECDHVFPVSRGGGHEDENLVTACVPCNRSKRAKTIDEWIGGMH